MINSVLKLAAEALQASSSTPRLDAEVLLSHVLKKNRTFFYTYPETCLTPEQDQCYQQLLAQRQRGVPIAYLIQQREFWSQNLYVTPATLIPRPETEDLVACCLNLLAQRENLRVLDLGTGSGAIAIALAIERPSWQIIASDKSAEALAVAAKNIQSLQLSNVHCVESDWFSAFENQRFNAIISNPPYLAWYDPHLEQGDLRYEPQQALVGGEDGLMAFRHLIHDSPLYLKSEGLLLVEHGYNQKAAVQALFCQAGYQGVQCWPDSGGQDRICGGWIS